MTTPKPKARPKKKPAPKPPRPEPKQKPKPRTRKPRAKKVRELPVDLLPAMGQHLFSLVKFNPTAPNIRGLILNRLNLWIDETVKPEEISGYIIDNYIVTKKPAVDLSNKSYAFVETHTRFEQGECNYTKSQAFSYRKNIMDADLAVLARGVRSKAALMDVVKSSMISGADEHSRIDADPIIETVAYRPNAVEHRGRRFGNSLALNIEDFINNHPEIVAAWANPEGVPAEATPAMPSVEAYDGATMPSVEDDDEEDDEDDEDSDEDGGEEDNEGEAEEEQREEDRLR